MPTDHPPTPHLIATTAACLIVCLASNDAIASELGPISTERPSFSASPIALTPGIWQIETGYQVTHDDDNGNTSREQSLPIGLLRVALVDRLEMQLGNINHSWLEKNETRTEGYEDITLGLKWQLNDSAASVPAGLFASVSLPTGSDEFSSGEYDPTLGLLWSYSGPLDFFGAAMLSYSDEQYSFDNGIGISFSPADGYSAYVEYVANMPEDDDTGHVLNTGLSWLVTDDMQLDISAGVGLNEQADDYYAGVGFSYRFR